eukprot:677246-Rhodomonas_salina.1
MARTAPPRASRQNGDDWRLAKEIQRQWRVEDFFADFCAKRTHTTHFLMSLSTFQQQSEMARSNVKGTQKAQKLPPPQ